jgi:hypothetical protein
VNINCNSEWFYCGTFLCDYLYTDCVIVIRHCDEGHNSDGTELVKNINMLWNMFMNVCLSVRHTSM